MTYNDLEVKRKKYRNIVLSAIIIIAAIICCNFFFYSVAGGIFTMLLFPAILISAVVTIGPRKEYRKAYKDYIVIRGFEEIFTDIKYEPDEGMPRSIIEDTRMMHMGNVYRSNDYLSASYKGVAFQQADVLIQREYESTDSDGNSCTNRETIFRGRWMVFDFNKEFKSNVQVAQKGFRNNIVADFYQKDGSRYYKKIQMESESFNKKFKVYAQSEQEAFYILTPSLMEKIERLGDNNKGKLLLCFINNRLHIGLYDNKDSFEAPNCLFKIDEEKEINKTAGDRKIITQFIDELNLDNTLFKKISISNQ